MFGLSGNRQFEERSDQRIFKLIVAIKGQQLLTGSDDLRHGYIACLGEIHLRFAARNLDTADAPGTENNQVAGFKFTPPGEEQAALFVANVGGESHAGFKFIQG